MKETKERKESEGLRCERNHSQLIHKMCEGLLMQMLHHSMPVHHCLQLCLYYWACIKTVLTEIHFVFIT
jgi:hypothetical protein